MREGRVDCLIPGGSSTPLISETIVTEYKILYNISSKWKKYSGILSALEEILYIVFVPDGIKDIEYMFQLEEIS